MSIKNRTFLRCRPSFNGVNWRFHRCFVVVQPNQIILGVLQPFPQLQSDGRGSHEGRNEEILSLFAAEHHVQKRTPSGRLCKFVQVALQNKRYTSLHGPETMSEACTLPGDQWITTGVLLFYDGHYTKVKTKDYRGQHQRISHQSKRNT